MHHKWRDLLFLHWAYDPREVQRTLPEGLYVDTFDHKAYIGIVPFFMKSVRPRFLPPVPLLSDFLELNLRTYVYDSSGTPGVWFYSLDASQWLAVQIARRFFNLPYYYASMRAAVNTSKGEVYFTSKRRNTNPSLRSNFRYRRKGAARHAEVVTLDFFLVERYVLFSRRNGVNLRGRVSHPPYPLYDAQALQWDDHLFTLDGIRSPGRAPDHIRMSPGVDVEIYTLEQLT